MIYPLLVSTIGFIKCKDRWIEGVEGIHECVNLEMENVLFRVEQNYKLEVLPALEDTFLGIHDCFLNFDPPLFKYPKDELST